MIQPNLAAQSREMSLVGIPSQWVGWLAQLQCKTDEAGCRL